MSEWNDEQRRAVESYDQAVLVMAPVGTGKTKTITDRAVKAIENGVDPRRMLCLSFTNKAAREMKERLFQVLPKKAGEITISTFHGLCASILRAEAATLDIDSDFLIYDEEDCRELFSQLWHAYGLHVPREDQDRFEFLLSSAAAKARLSRYDEVTPRDAYTIFAEALRDGYFKDLDRSQNFRFKELLTDYVALLRENHALDFADLIVGVNLLWDRHPLALARWQQRFAWIQVDEVQDTNRSEYRILAMIAAQHKQLSFFGDIDQTIYEWRGSSPFAILDHYRKEFAPVKEIAFVRNYRSTRNILEACEAHILQNANSVTKEIQPHVAEAGDAVTIHEAPSPMAEAKWIANEIQRLRNAFNLNYRDFAVLVRTNFTARDFSAAFERFEIPHVKVDEFKFFQRVEIKAALAHIRLLINRFDGTSIARYLETPPKRIGEAALNDLGGAPKAAGLRLCDLLSGAGDPFEPLLLSMYENKVVVFDLETTGLNRGEDEIVELAAARCGANGIVETYHAYIRNSRPVGESFRTHNLSDEFLAQNGRDAAQVLQEFENFSKGCVLCGHNVFSFDLPMLAAGRQRLGMKPVESEGVFDTLDMTRRFFRLPRYTLAQIAQSLKLPTQPTHRADADVAATVELLLEIKKKLEDGAAERKAAAAKHAAKFKALVAKLNYWRERMELERPPELLARVLEESGLQEYYLSSEDGEKRLIHLEELQRLFAKHDDPSLAPRESLRNIMGVVALGTDADRQMAGEDRVLVLTVHQAKGLEFDTVFISGATDDEFPSRRSQREGRTDEEHRLFYVAMSRAKRRLFITWPSTGARGRKNLRSRYVQTLPPHVIQFG
jgi:DNA helicase-2/ATP-dependent DNA helicase PcrA